MLGIEVGICYNFFGYKDGNYLWEIVLEEPEEASEGQPEPRSEPREGKIVLGDLTEASEGQSEPVSEPREGKIVLGEPAEASEGQSEPVSEL